MIFLNPILLAAGAACVAVPILIHLLARRRRRPVRWGAMRFLLEAYRRQRRRLRLEQLLLLAARCLIVLLVAMALGRPVLEALGSLGIGSPRDVYVVIDNSIASSVRDPDSGRTALERHKEAARNLLDALGPTDRAGLVALGGPADPIVAPASSDIAAVRSLIDEVRPTDSAADVAGALDAIAQAVEREPDGAGPLVVATLSDFTNGAADTARALGAPMERIAGIRDVRLLALRPDAAPPSNVQVVSAEPLRTVVLTRGEGASLAQQVRVELRRTGPGLGEEVTTVRARMVDAQAPASPGAPEARAQVAWRAGQSRAGATLSVEADAAEGQSVLMVEIDRDALDADNTLLRPAQVREALRVGVADRRRFGAAPSVDEMSSADWIRLALRPDGAAPVEVQDVTPSPLDSAVLDGLDALIATRPDLIDADGWRRISAFVQRGGLLVVTPPPDASVHLWTDEMTSALSLDWTLAREPVSFEDGARLAETQPSSDLLRLIHTELADLAAPVTIERALPFDAEPAGATVALRLDSGAPLLLAASPAADNGASRGLVVYLAAPPTLTWTDLPAKPLMVPLFQEIVRQGVGLAEGASAVSAGRRAGAERGVRELVGVWGPIQGERFPIASDQQTSQPVRRAGLLRPATGRGALAVNADVEGARTDAQPEDAVGAWLAGAVGGGAEVTWLDDERLAEALMPERGGSPISAPLLFAAAALAFLEAAMARWFSHATRAAPTAPAMEAAA